MSWEQVRESVRREDILMLYQELFEVRFGDRMFTIAAKAIGFVPTATRTLSAEGQKGRVGEFDPLLVLLLASVNARYKGRLETMENALELYRLFWDKLHDSWEARTIPSFSENREYGAWLLMLTSVDYGMPAVQLYRRIREKPELLDLSRYRRVYLKNVFMAYKEAYINFLERMELEKAPGDPSPAEQKLEWAEDWLTAAARYFGDSSMA